MFTNVANSFVNCLVVRQGEVLDYGPFSFLSVYDPDYVSASFDMDGQYAFGRQLDACRWNLRRFGTALSLLPDVFCAPAAATDATTNSEIEQQIPSMEEVLVRTD